MKWKELSLWNKISYGLLIAEPFIIFGFVLAIIIILNNYQQTNLELTNKLIEKIMEIK